MTPFFHPPFLERLALVLVGPAREIGVDAHHAVDFANEYAPLEVVGIERPAFAGGEDRVRAYSARGDTRVAFFLGWMKGDVPFGWPRPILGKLFGEGPCFLQHHHVSVQRCKVVVNSLANGGTQPVDVP